MPRFQDIPKLTKSAGYRVNVSWKYIEEQIESQARESRGGGIDLEPDFQRAHVWTVAQQIAYVEYILRGGISGRDLYFNCNGWMNSFKGPYVIVDGKQRLNAVRQFLANKIPVFGGNYYRDYTDTLRISEADFVWHVNDLKTRAEVLTWYLEFNGGGTPHTPEELDRVRALLAKEKA